MQDGQGDASDRSGVLGVLKGSRFFAPLLALGAGAVLLGSLLLDPEIKFSEQQSPGLWPSAMVGGFMIVAAAMLLWSIHDAWRARRMRRDAARAAADAPDEAERDGLISDREAEIIARGGAVDADHDNRRALLGIVGIFGYGIAVGLVGYPLATFAIIAYWMAIWDVRSISQIAITGFAGTGANLVIFLKVGYLPLPRGEGVFDDFTVFLYQFFHLY